MGEHTEVMALAGLGWIRLMGSWIAIPVLLLACTNGGPERRDSEPAPAEPTTTLCERAFECLIDTCSVELAELAASGDRMFATFEQRQACTRGSTCEDAREDAYKDHSRAYTPLRHCETACVAPFDPNLILKDTELKCESTPAAEASPACPYVHALRSFEKPAFDKPRSRAPKRPSRCPAEP